MDILYAKACLYAYPHIDERLQQLHEVRMSRALNSMFEPYFPLKQCTKIVEMQFQTESLTELKEKIEKALSIFTPEDMDLLEYKYFHRKPKEYFKDFDFRSRSYFRKQCRIAKTFAKRLERFGVDEQWLNENLKSYLKGYLSLAKAIQESIDSRKQKIKEKKGMKCFNNLRKNASGYSDPTTYRAIINADRELQKRRKIKDNTCVCCGKEVPEGRQVCPDCEGK